MLESDVCIVGAGPAGVAVALGLAEAGRRVLVLESGGGPAEPADAGRDEIESVGVPLGPAGPPGGRRFGGTSWYGRCVVQDPTDFDSRPWLASSGWPISRAEVEAWYPKAARFLGLARPEALTPGFWSHEPAACVLGGGGLSTCVHLITGAKDVGRRYQRRFARSSTATVLLHATVVGLDVIAGSRTIARVRVATHGGHQFSVRARRYVLACGLENARLLLLLSADTPGVFGPSSDALGRCYMNHVRCEGVARLRLDPAHPAYLALFRRFTEHYVHRSRCRAQLATRLDDDTQRREKVLNAGAFFYASSSPRLAALKEPFDRLRRGRIDPAEVRQLAGELPLLARAGLARLRRRPFLVDSLVMVEQLEQPADPESRVNLGTRVDRFGRPVLRLDWRISRQTLRAQRCLHRLLAERVHQQRIGRLESALLQQPDAEPEYSEGGHPMGASRMSADPRQGVVDCNARVHALDNLYIAGSSIFPTGGQANPTLALVALALRLAEHLRNEGGR